ncbi:amidohydrolase family protein [Nakamurella multipartita]|uniref:Aminocarboxymuconate-semialdehyde decarboxylase n=1 Tax=Nakamurella multipartita (strain ATCC 700099 / DSM 44233 / CIP 104796 / JCM 9543 / NBRC 105858 / Y-104) TaxID=479431 RepID=C8X9X5_NAKMY|nr:amidohydrolase family protein [Nakamurella multipartita]ACV81175.1 Aminocarboxymuconate-semialdehyde decarboxylase [Nakamurella multipartita DSM 44233]
MITAVAGGVVDVHAHWLPRELFTLPPGAPYGALTDRAGELHLGEVPLSIAATALSDVPAIRDDMRRARVGVRVLSAPPFAFPVGDAGAGADAGDYVASFNESLAAVVGESDGALAGLGLVGLHDPDRVREELATLAVTPGIAGVAIPPLLRGDSLDRGVLREVVVGAAELDLAVLVHPMQLPRPEWSSYYLANLIGNPTETATAVASLLLSGLAEELPLLRICFVHGGGSAPALLGRWEHAFTRRADVARSAKRGPREGFRELFLDTVTHDPDALDLLVAQAGDGRIVAGSDYPFDMAQPHPVAFAVDNGLPAATLAASGRAFLGLTPAR